MVMVVDPPSGWKYGFPKECPEHVWESTDVSVFRKWLIESGYPEKEAEFGMEYLRCWKDE